MQPINQEHIKAEFFPTPLQVIQSLLNNYTINPTHILEPCAGNGAISRAILDHFPTSEHPTIMQIEIRREELLALSKFGKVHIGNFLDWWPDADTPPFSAIITNPPFSLAQKFLEHCFKIAPKAPVIMLLRLGFLSSQKRKGFINANPPSDILVLSKRPSFIPSGKHDITDYAWICWNGTGKGVRSV